MSFEKVILSNLVFNEEYTRKISPFLIPEYFSNNAEKAVLKLITDFISKYNVNPTIESLVITVSNSDMNEGQFKDVMEVIEQLERDDNHQDWLSDETEKFCQQKALYNAIHKAISVMDGDDKDIDKNGIPALLTDALGITFNSNVGHDYWDDVESQWDFLHSQEAKHPFSLDILNKVTKGGIPKKILAVILSPINAGKSIHLVQQAADWMMAGKNVLYISMEMAEEVVRERIDVVITDSNFDDVMGMSKEQYSSRMKDVRKKTSGRLIIKEYPAGAANVNHFRHLIQELKQKKNFSPDLICVDYLTIMSSCKLPASAKGNTNTYFTSCAEELRAFAQEQDVPIWTAVQLDRSTQGASDAGMGNVGLAIGIAATADFMFCILTPPEFLDRGQVIGKVIKNRFSSYKGKFILGLKPEKQRFYDVDAQAVAMSEDELKELGLTNIIPMNAPKIDMKKATMAWDFE